ncbi:polysaccharide biosynthesis C-terminal domain-containing protein [Natronomonas gomsonensis]|uniref:oligosaccharide flippase family protein n=1 Tax=Natronomonas gomsonensis TaxID=1046043 RepID=UPI0015BBB96A|nr:polysaccharide biosynthesis C-terminal domain-containing protein [Natronomonas gomsonensis]
MVVFLSRLLSSAIGFVATVIFARLLGAEVIGIYTLVITLVAWLSLGGRLGLGKAMKKRISEDENRGEYLFAGIVAIGIMLMLLQVVVFTGQRYIETYIGGFSEYAALSVVWFVSILLVVQLAYVIITATLKGQHLVHLAGILDPIWVFLRSVFQVALVVLGFSVVGLLVGYIVGGILVVVIGTVFISIRLQTPTRVHFESLAEYAKFSWLGGLKSRSFNDVDILVLGAMVPSSLVGIYSIAWGLTKFLDLFGNAIGGAVFPEISNLTAKETEDAASRLIEDVVAFAGFISIPGAVGGILLSDRLLMFYGSEFVRGTEVLSLLLISILLYSFMRQFLNALNALDRPEIAFRANIVFIICNTTLNIILIYFLGWIGAAIASVLSVTVGTLHSYRLLVRTVSIQLPYSEIGRQTVAALLMGGVVWLLRSLLETSGLIRHNLVVVSVLVGIGSALYFTTLLVISTRVRSTINRNAPFDLFFLNK